MRVSVTDRCNIRCTYCMPEGNLAFLDRAELMTFEEITRVVSLLSSQGVHDIRLTGGEPLLRRDLVGLVKRLAELREVKDLSLTTNGILLGKFALALKQAGLQRLNISLDALDEATFRTVARRPGLQQVLDGIQAAIDAGFTGIKLNAIALRGLTEHQVHSLLAFAIKRELVIRFIEYMPLDAEHEWEQQKVLTGKELLQFIVDQWGDVQALTSANPAQPSSDYQLLQQPVWSNGLRPTFGLICPVSQPFCDRCDRLRLTADGMLRNCLFSTQEWNVRSMLRSGADDEAILALVQRAVAEKEAGHLINRPEFEQPARAMYQIGG